MKNGCKILVSLAVFGLSMSKITAQTWPPAGMLGDGKELTPWQISSAQQLKALADWVNADNGDETAGKYYKLMNDIDLSDYATDEGWTPIGSTGEGSLQRFKGSLDGNNKKITGLRINNPTRLYTGLFGAIYDGTIQNLGIENAQILNARPSGAFYIGSIAGYVSNAKILNCYSTGGNLLGGAESGVGTCYTGGMAGYINNSTISNCYSTGMALSISNAAAVYAGGIAGYVNNTAKILNCYSTESILFAADHNTTEGYIGGIAGAINSTSSISHCAALNPFLASSTDAQWLGRVTGLKDVSSTLTDNIAFAGMMEGTTITWLNKGLANLDGADFTILQVNADGTLGDRFTSPEWVTAEGKLPGFDNAVGMPFYLQDVEGTDTDPYLIHNAEQLKSLADYVNSFTNTSGKYFKLVNDIDLSGYDNWTPIGGYLGLSGFSGNFDGNNKKITGLKIKIDDNAMFMCGGLFGFVAVGTIQNLGIENADIVCTLSSSGSGAGGVAGYVFADCKLLNCYSTGMVSASGKSCFAGGVVGVIVRENSIISNCYSTATVSSTGIGTGNSVYAGGVVGAMRNGTYYAEIAHCAALNPSISCTGDNTYLGRVTGFIDAGSKLSDNIAFAGMLKLSGGRTWDNKGLDDIDGEDVSVQTINEDSTLGDRFTSPVWATAKGKLPGLNKPVNMPSHLQLKMVGIESITNNEMQVYPNPTNGELRIVGEWRITDIQVFDRVGTPVQIFPVSTLSQETVINISHLPGGTYFVKIITTSGEVIKKVIKE